MVMPENGDMLHIVVDMQGAQTASRTRGIGRFAREFTLALGRLAAPKHRVTLLLNGALHLSLDAICQQFSELPVPPGIEIWSPLDPCTALEDADLWRRGASELLYESALRRLSPDFVIVTSLFEGHGSSAVSSIGKLAAEINFVVVLHDLIPLLYAHEYLTDAKVARWYYRQLDHLTRASFLLAVSESSRREAIDFVGFPEKNVLCIGEAADARFKPREFSDQMRRAVLLKQGISRPFALYTSAGDVRKNNEVLARAFCSVMRETDSSHQLVFVSSSIPEEVADRLKQVASDSGLLDDCIVVADSVDDDDLVALYNLCDVFVFPSWHEGFGLPPLEAMACGARVIASRASSIPEVVGLDDALFDPLDQDDIARAIRRALLDPAWRQRLKDHSLRRCAEFSWESTARRAVKGLEGWAAEVREATLQSALLSRGLPDKKGRRRLAYVSPLSPMKNATMTYTVDLLRALSVHYDVEVVSPEYEPVTGGHVPVHAPIRSISWFEQHGHEYDRVLYHVGAAPCYGYVLDLLERQPGVVVLHDFHLGRLLLDRMAPHNKKGLWGDSLLHSHGWSAFLECRCVGDASALLSVADNWPCNLSVIQRALGLIVHSEHFERSARRWYGDVGQGAWARVAYLRALPKFARQTEREVLGISEEDLLVCSFGPPDRGDFLEMLIAAWRASRLHSDPRCRLVVVREGRSLDDVIAKLRASVRNERIRVVGPLGGHDYHGYLASADIAVQASGVGAQDDQQPVLDCMAFAIPTIVCDEGGGGMEDIASSAALLVPQGSGVDGLARALNSLHGDLALRQEIGGRARKRVSEFHAPGRCARLYADAIESFHQGAAAEAQETLRRVAWLGRPKNRPDVARLAVGMARIWPPPQPDQKTIFLDISELHARDAKSGIQRVVRNILKELLEAPPEGYRIEPIYATDGDGYRLARVFTAKWLGIEEFALTDPPILPGHGDVFFAPDLQADVVPRHEKVLREWSARGTKVVFLVHDILPITFAEGWEGRSVRSHTEWLEAISRCSDGLLCVSRTVAQEVQAFLNRYTPTGARPLAVGWAHNGASLEVSASPVTVLNPQQRAAVRGIERYPAFLMVGTLEPRKGHAQTIAAFETLWARGVPVSLVIVGKMGWGLGTVLEQIERHPERERYLFWLEVIDDGYLTAVYKASACLLAASYDEGFGLPLVEAARHGLPILARDIPVFREVAQDNAVYFPNTDSPHRMADAIQEWLRTPQADRVGSDGLRWLTWPEATKGMMDIILSDAWQVRWNPPSRVALRVGRWWGGHAAFGTETGQRVGMDMVCAGRRGYLLFGNYQRLGPGSYRAMVRGTRGEKPFRGAVRAEVVCKRGTAVVSALILPDRAVWKDDNVVVDFSFALAQAQVDTEVRIWHSEYVELSIAELEIARVPGLYPEEDWEATPSQSLEQEDGIIGSWGASHPDIYSSVGYRTRDAIYAVGKAGYLVYGPYINLSAGSYILEVHGEASVEASCVKIEVSSDIGTKIYQRLETEWPALKTSVTPLRFTLGHYTEKVEFRIWIEKDSVVGFKRLRLTEGSSGAL